MKLSSFQAILLLSGALLMAACSRPYDPGQAKACSEGIDVGYEELRDAEARGLSGTVHWTKAASLLGAAKVQYEFDRYPNCIDKVKRARALIRRAGSA